VLEDLFRNLGPPVDPVQDLERPGLARRRLAEPVREPIHERARLLREAEAHEGVDRERGVPDPRVAVVPVPRAADLLGKAGGGRRDDCPGRLIGEELEDERRAVDHLAPAAAVIRLREPTAPVLDRRLVRLARLVLGVRARDVVLLDRLENEGDALARPQGELAVHVPSVAGERCRGLQSETQVRRAEEDPVLVLLRLVVDAAIVEARLELEAKAHLSPDAENAANEAMAVHLLPTPRDRHESLELADPFRREEAGDEDVRVREVELLGGPSLARRRDAVVTALFAVEDRCKDAGRVECRAAVPVDRPLRAHKRDGVQIADNPVFGNREVVVHATTLRRGGHRRQGLGVSGGRTRSTRACRGRGRHA
jgi:hypothetical protein